MNDILIAPQVYAMLIDIMLTDYLSNRRFLAISSSALLAGASFFSLCLYLVYNGHFHEDAYILFRYVDNIVNGHGIAYYPGGEPAEGATDFLWLIVLSAMSKVGIDVGMSTALLNMLAVTVITVIFLNETRKALPQGRWLLYAMSFLWIFNSYSVAAMLGFSVMVYMSVVVLLIFCYLRPGFVLWLPALSLLLGLIRPDGVIMGIAFAGIGFWSAHRAGVLRKYIIVSVIVFIVGLAYFIWRANYFGNLLPLPLYVKGHESFLTSIDQQYRWIKKSIYILIPTIIFLWKSETRWLYLRALMPVIALFTAFTFVTQSQNIGYRFQGPVFIAVYYVLILLIRDYVQVKGTFSKAKPYLIALLVILVGINVHYFNKSNSRISDTNYVNDFAYKATQLLPENEAILLTEAGRFAFWDTKDHMIIDMVGLNTVYPAKNMITVDYIESFNPGLVYFFHFRLDELTGISDKRYVRLDKKGIARFIKIQMPEVTKNRSILPKVAVSSLVSHEFLVNNMQKYDVFMVDTYGDGYFQNIYALRKDLNLSDEFETALSESLSETDQPSYAELREQARALMPRHP